MIGGTYEYLMSSLPNLSFQNTEETNQAVLSLLKKYGGGIAIEQSPVEILDKEVEKFMPASQFYFFQKMNLKNIHKKEFQNTRMTVLSGFSKSIYKLKKEIRAWRISKSGGNEKIDQSNITKIIGDGSHLEKEIRILKYQWRKLESLSAGHFSSYEAVFDYKIKLLILLRWWSFDAERGFAKFTELTHKN